jgi:hypothetical protein
MVFTLQLCELDLPTSQVPPARPQDATSEWEVQVTTDATESRIKLVDPFADSSRFGLEPESAVKWYLEKYATEEPFETTKAEFAAEAIFTYGRELAAQVARNCSLPKTGDLEIEIICHPGTAKATAVIGNHALRQLLWEVLEDATLWPPSYSFNSVSVVRSIHGNSHAGTPESNPVLRDPPSRNRFNILLVVSRPGRDGNSSADIDYQLVSRCLVAIIDHARETNPDMRASLRILRPSTWLAFREHLQEHEPGYYDLVHLDMYGTIKESSKSTAMYVLLLLVTQEGLMRH